MGHSNAASSSTNQLFTSGISTSSYLRAPHTEVQTPARGTKRRRKPKHVVQNACLNCKRRRTKASNFNEHRPFRLAIFCDGKEPCGKCIEKPPQQRCCYQPHIKYIKMELVESFRSHDSWKRNAERIFHAIEANENTSAIIERIQNHESVESIAQWLQETNGGFESPSPKDSSPSRGNITTYLGLSDYQAIDAAMGPARGIPTSQFTNLRIEETQGSISAIQQAKDETAWSSLLGLDNTTDSMASTNDDIINWTPNTVTVPNTLSQYPAIGHWHGQTTDHSTLDSTALYARDQGQAAILSHESGGDHSDHKSLGPLSWTNVTSDRQLVDHLIALYFCWEYPTFVPLSKEHVLEAYKTGDHNYCSELLVNEIQAVGCRFSSQAGARANPNDNNTAGDHFFAEAERLLFEEKDHGSLTTIQALGLMAIREASSGHSSQSIFSPDNLYN
ncbi:fungal specific transcription factor protein [Rutstroemia sp. NJR-2017a BBW]|nr:fungal specific transcription factor protein [Rutstroemia sp. NJR-2017a BBW]